MIVVQERLTELFETLPLIGGKQPYFDGGSKEYLNRLLSGYFKQGEAPYPLIWMVNNTESENEINGYVEKQATFILCTRNTDVNMYRPERLATTYKDVLIPLYDAMLESFKTGGIASYDEESIDRQFHDNYSVTEKKNSVIDIWDAIEVTLDLKIFKEVASNGCINS